MHFILRTLWFVLIFQILALSALPPALGAGEVYNSNKDKQSQLYANDDFGLPGQFGGFVKNEQDVFTEEEAEDFPHLEYLLPDGILDLYSCTKGFFDEIPTLFTVDIPLTVALFVRFHCWKMDFCLD